jgi:hypothetical protein
MRVPHISLLRCGFRHGLGWSHDRRIGSLAAIRSVSLCNLELESRAKLYLGSVAKRGGGRRSPRPKRGTWGTRAGGRAIGLGQLASSFAEEPQRACLRWKSWLEGLPDTAAHDTSPGFFLRQKDTRAKNLRKRMQQAKQS